MQAKGATAEAGPWRRTTHGIVLRLRLTPKSSRSTIDGVTVTPDGPAVQARVNAVPANGAANQALIELVAGWIGCSKTAVTLVSGGKSRIKSVAIAGSADDIERRLLALVGLSGKKTRISERVGRHVRVMDELRRPAEDETLQRATKPRTTSQ